MFKSNAFMAQPGVCYSPFLAPKEIEEFREKREEILQIKSKAMAPSEKALIFEVIETKQKLLENCRNCKKKSRIPLLLSSKR